MQCRPGATSLCQPAPKQWVGGDIRLPIAVKTCNRLPLCCVQERGLAVCLAVLETQLQQGPQLQDVLASHVLQAVTNAAEYGPCNVELRRSPQLSVIRELASMQGRRLLAAAATQALRMAGVKDGGSSEAT